MKEIQNNKIINIKHTDIFDRIFGFKYSNINTDSEIKIIYLSELLKARKNLELYDKVKLKPAIYSNVYSPKDELELFEELFTNAIKNKEKIHIVGVSLKKEIEILENYYKELGFLREDINCFLVDFSIPFVTVSVNIENLIWKGSDYKSQRENIFFIPPIRESGENKAMFKGINRGVIAGININNFGNNELLFLEKCMKEEKILPLTMGKILYYNLNAIGINNTTQELKISY